jgi:DNA (cytosine-5)-methyltransferase 1
MIKALSLFSSAGVGELLLEDLGIDVVVSNELLEKRSNFYKHVYPNKLHINGDIRKQETKDTIISNINKDVKLLIATPPCQGVSSLGKNKMQDQYIEDERNFLIYDVFYFIENHDFDAILIENVERYSKMFFPYKGKLLKLYDLLIQKYSTKYTIEHSLLNAKDYGVPQSRPRYFIKMFKSNYSWPWPKQQQEITLKEAIGHLPSLESGETSNIRWHYAKTHNERDILAMKHTPSGKSAMKNEIYYPKRKDGKKIKGFHNTYKRLDWEVPCHARTTNSGNIGSHNNVHPGRLKSDGTYTDARVLSIHELMIVSSIPLDWNIPEWASDTQIRHVIGESVPPLLMYNVLKGLKKD